MKLMDKVYFFGERGGRFVKIGFTNKPLSTRRKGLETGQWMRSELILLAAVHGSKTNEAELHSHFAHLAYDANSKELYKSDAELLHYINWLRQQWWTYLAEEDPPVDCMPAWPEWMPTPERRVPFADEDPIANGEMFERHVSYSGPLAGTFWNKMSTPTPLGDDFYTPVGIIEAARSAMGDIDLDAASHWRANQKHKIKTYFHLSRSAHDNKWQGRVWLNPPYGNNAPWFEDIIKYWDSRDITQLCMLSPMWVFTTQLAKPIIDRSSAMILLSPTPPFWGHPKGKTGTNHPHAIIYLGNRTTEFHIAFAEYGIPVSLPDLSKVLEAAE